MNQLRRAGSLASKADQVSAVPGLVVLTHDWLRGSHGLGSMQDTRYAH